MRKISLLFSDYYIGNVKLKNRIVMSPMCMYSCFDKDGRMTDWHYSHYLSRATGQVGLIIVESTAVTSAGRITYKDLGIWDDSHVPGLSKLVKMVHEQGAKIGIQLSHAGRKARLDGDIIAPSPIPFDSDRKTPKEMTHKQIQEVITEFTVAAMRAKQAGFDVIEIHAAHGYLINEFLSPLSNKRKDAYGGERQKRYRFLKEIIYSIKEIWDGPLMVRISADEYDPSGNTKEDYVFFSKLMKDQGIDLIDCSSGGVVSKKVKAFPGYQLPITEKIKKEAKIATGAVGLITKAVQAESILKSQQADLIFLGRELLRDPYWPRRAAFALNDKIEAPKQYSRAWFH